MEAGTVLAANLKFQRIGAACIDQVLHAHAHERRPLRLQQRCQVAMLVDQVFALVAEPVQQGAVEVDETQVGIQRQVAAGGLVIQ